MTKTQCNPETLPASVLVKHQTKTYGPRFYHEHGAQLRITVTVRYDDQCGNGHNSFSITASIDEKCKNGRWLDYMGGCCHDEVAKHFPELVPFIKWHLTSSDGPMHYVANTVYHALQHEPKSAWVYWADPPAVERHCVKYCSVAEARDITMDKPGYSIEIDPKTSKTRNLEYARNCAVWPNATDEELTAPGLEERLMARLPALMQEFKAAVESLGFVY